MKTFGTILIAISALTVSAMRVSYDFGYDDPKRSLSAVACSDGDNGLITKYHVLTQGAIPAFPYIGGSVDIAGWNSPNCGQCYSVSYQGRTIHVLAIDHDNNGLNIAKYALDDLTNGRATEIGWADAQVAAVDYGYCAGR